MTDSGYDELMKYVSFEYVISINIAKLLKNFSWTLRDSYVACMISLDDISLPNTGTMFNPTKKSDTQDGVSREENTNNNHHDTNSSSTKVELDDDKTFIPNFKTDFKAHETFDPLVPLRSDNYNFSEYERANIIDFSKRIIG